MNVRVRSQSGAMALWLKIVLGLVVFCVVGGGIMVALVGGVLMKAGQDATDPAKAGKVARDIVGIASAPPPWKITMGMDTGLFKLAVFSNPDNTAIVNFARYPKAISKENNNIFEGQLNGAGFITEKTVEETIAGQPVKLLIGRCSAKGQEFAAEMAQIKTPSGDLITIQAMEPQRKQFDPQIVQPLYKAIETFK